MVLDSGSHQPEPELQHEEESDGLRMVTTSPELSTERVKVLPFMLQFPCRSLVGMGAPGGDGCGGGGDGGPFFMHG